MKAVLTVRTVARRLEQRGNGSESGFFRWHSGLTRIWVGRSGVFAGFQAMGERCRQLAVQIVESRFLVRVHDSASFQQGR